MVDMDASDKIRKAMRFTVSYTINTHTESNIFVSPSVMNIANLAT